MQFFYSYMLLWGHQSPIVMSMCVFGAAISLKHNECRFVLDAKSVEGTMYDDHTLLIRNFQKYCSQKN